MGANKGKGCDGVYVMDPFPVKRKQALEYKSG